MAKLFASETAMWTTIKAVQIHGGYGYVTDFPMERYMRDAKLSRDRRRDQRSAAYDHRQIPA